MEAKNNLTLPKIVSREEWLNERKKLLKAEKEHTQKHAELNAQRRRLPMVEIEKDYKFKGQEGEFSLRDLFEGRRQLITYHFMLGPGWDEGCTGCSFVADNIADLSHLHARDTSLVMVSRAPLDEIEAYQKRMGWDEIPWYSSFGSDFNYDFHVTIDKSAAPVLFNYQTEEELNQTRPNWVNWPDEQPGVSVFLKDNGKIFHTYSSYERGLELLLSSLMYLDLTPLGRQENWEQPDGRGNDKAGSWWRRHDQYEE